MALLDSEAFGFSNSYNDFVSYGILATATGGGNSPVVLTGGPLGDNYLGSATASNSVRRTFTSGASAFFFGQRTFYSNTSYIYFMDPAFTEQFHLAFSTTGTIAIIRNATTLATSALGAIILGAWNYVEVGAVISPTAGSVIVRVNGVVVLSVSGVNTQNSGASNLVANVQWGTGTGAVPSTTHVYFCDNTGPAPWNSFLGDVRVQTIRITSDDAVQFTPTPASLTMASGTVSTTASNTAAANTVYYQKISVSGSVGGTLSQAQMTLATSYTGNVMMALYGFNAAATLPSGAPLAISAAVANPVAGTVTFTFSAGPHLSAGSIYWLALLTDTASSWRQNTSNPGSSQCSQTQAYTSGFPTTPAPGAVGTDLFYMNMAIAPNNSDVVALIPPVPFTYYNADANVGDQDTFNCAPMSASLTSVFGVHVKILTAKSDAGARSIQPLLKSGTTTVAGTSAGLTLSMLPQRLMCQTDPDTSAQWSQAAVNAANPGYKVSA